MLFIDFRETIQSRDNIYDVSEYSDFAGQKINFTKCESQTKCKVILERNHFNSFKINRRSELSLSFLIPGAG